MGCSAIVAVSQKAVQCRDGEPIYYPGRNKLWIIAGGPRTTTNFIVKFYLFILIRGIEASYAGPSPGFRSRGPHFLIQYGIYAATGGHWFYRGVRVPLPSHRRRPCSYDTLA